jgi:hypothetical protein
MFFLMLWNTTWSLRGPGPEPVVTLLWTFKLPCTGLHGTPFHPGVAQLPLVLQRHAHSTCGSITWCSSRPAAGALLPHGHHDPVDLQGQNGRSVDSPGAP